MGQRMGQKMQLLGMFRQKKMKIKLHLKAKIHKEELLRMNRKPRWKMEKMNKKKEIQNSKTKDQK